MWEFSHVFFNDYDFMKGRKYRVDIVKDPPHHLKQKWNLKIRFDTLMPPFSSWLVVSTNMIDID